MSLARGTGRFEFEAVCLGIDPALHTSGAVILIPDYGGITEDEHEFRGEYALHEFGKVQTQSERERYLDSTLEMADELDLPAFVIAETWDPPRNRRGFGAKGAPVFVPDKKWNFKTILGMGEGWGRWSAEIEHVNAALCEDGVPSIAVERVTPNEWRDAVFGPRRPKDSDRLKLIAKRLFEGVFGYSVSDDVAEAACIGLYGLQLPDVAEHVASVKTAAEAAKNAKKRRRAARR